MQNGTVKFFNAAKGFGFITPDEGGKDVFVAAASAASSGVPALKQGQRVSFETAPDGKGPKAVNLTVIANPNPPPQQNKPQPQQHRPAAQPAPAQQRLALYYDPSSDAALDILDALRDLGHDPRLVDYIATPPNRDALKALSRLAAGGGQSLVHKYDPLFLELRLDDRFISENEFWDAIFEHPHLIKGPIVSNGTRAAFIRDEAALNVFLGVAPSQPKPQAPKLALVSNDAPAAEKAAPEKPVAEKENRKTEAAKAAAIVKETAPVKKPAPAKAEKASAKPAAKAPAKAVEKIKAPAKAAAKPKPAAKPAAKPKAKAAAKPAAKKPAKKAIRK